MNYSPNTFQSSGQQYTLNITLVPDTKMMPDDTVVSLDGQSIEEFTFSTELNNLLVYGQILYIDKYGQIDKFIEQQHCICNVLFGVNLSEQDGDISTGGIDDEKTFAHSFIIDNIKIIDRQSASIIYQIDIVSYMWYHCIANIAFSNNDKDPESIFSIFKQCLGLVELAYDDTFDEVKTDVKINYVSQANDNMFKIAAYLLDKLYFYLDTDNSVKFVFYDCIKGKYRILDLSNYDTLTTVSSTVLSFFKSNVEQLIQQDETNIGSLANSASMTHLYKTIFKKDIFSYDFKNNTFEKNDKLGSDHIIGYINEHMSYDDEYISKYHLLDAPEQLAFFKANTYWNLPVDAYNEVISSIETTGAITLNVTGDILRQCGSGVVLAIDRDINSLENDSMDELDNVKNKYKGFEGLWIASKVINVIRPNEQSFKQKVALFRNYTMKIPVPENAFE